MINLFYTVLLVTFLFSNQDNLEDVNSIHLNKRFVSTDIGKLHTKHMDQMDRDLADLCIEKFNVQKNFKKIDVYIFNLKKWPSVNKIREGDFNDDRLLFLFQNDDSVFYKIDLNNDHSLADEQLNYIYKEGYSDDHVIYYYSDSSYSKVDSTLLGIHFYLGLNKIGFCFKEELYGSFYINSTLYCIEINNERAVSLDYENPQILITKCNSSNSLHQSDVPKLTFKIEDNKLVLE